MKSPDPPKGELDTFNTRSGAGIHYSIMYRRAAPKEGTQLFNHNAVSNWGMISPDPPGGGIQSSRTLVLVLWHAAPKEAIELGSLATRSGTRGTQLHHPIFFN